MPSNRIELRKLRKLIADADLILETTPDLSRNRISVCRDVLRAALALTDDLINQSHMTATSTLGHKGGAVRLPGSSDRSTSAGWRLHGTRGPVADRAKQSE